MTRLCLRSHKRSLRFVLVFTDGPVMVPLSPRAHKITFLDGMPNTDIFYGRLETIPVLWTGFSRPTGNLASLL